jgi:hypothetical protein
VNGLWLSSWKEGVSGEGGSNEASILAGTGDRGLELTAGEDTYSKVLKVLW